MSALPVPHFDVIVIGAGPGGSLTAMQLARRGRRVALLDRTHFPRFAVGESSTPITSRTIEQISTDCGLDELAPLTRWGRWRDSLRQVTGGLKRGFTYYDHRVPASADTSGLWPTDPESRLLVAASANDPDGDSHWVRAEVDQFLVDICRRHDVDVRLGWSVEEILRERPWRIHVRQIDGDAVCEPITCDTLVDASGRAGAILRRFGYRDATDSIETNTAARFTHLVESGERDLGDADALPYQPHHAAVHHLLHDGWVWELPMSDGRSSVGRVWFGSSGQTRAVDIDKAMATWHHDLAGNLDVAPYGNLRDWLEPARLADPPRRWVHAKRVQHRWRGGRDMSRSFLALPTTLATIDPLHSTGLAHAITGAQRISDLIVHGANDAVARYVDQVECEIELLDRVISLAYRVWDRCDLFFDACMLYFALAIGDEEERIAGGFDPKRSTWRATDRQVQGAVAGAEAILMEAWKANRSLDGTAFRRELARICDVPLACRDDNLYAYTFG